MFKKLAITLFVLALFIGPVVGLKVFQIGSLIAFAQSMGMPPAAVATYTSTEQSWENKISAVGTLRPVNGVTLAAEMGGKVLEIAVESGASVKAGDLLVRIDAASEEAQLASAEANARLAQLNFERARDLVSKNTISRAELDQADATYKQALAQIENVRAAIAKKTIRAPFAGRVGIRLINIGQTVRDGDAIIPLHALDPIYLDFSLPQSQLGLVSEGLKVEAVIDGLPITAVGKITAISPQLDASTRSVKVQATLENPEEKLRPGMFGNVTVVLPTNDKVIAIPATAVVHAPFGDSVFVVEQKDGKTVARQKFVRLGVARGDFVAVVAGLEPGARVVTAGAFKLNNGSEIVIDDKMQPEASVAPRPANS